MTLTISFGMTQARRICSVFPLCIESKFFVKKNFFQVLCSYSFNDFPDSQDRSNSGLILAQTILGSPSIFLKIWSDTIEEEMVTETRLFPRDWCCAYDRTSVVRQITRECELKLVKDASAGYKCNNVQHLDAMFLHETENYTTFFTSIYFITFLLRSFTTLV